MRSAQKCFRRPCQRMRLHLLCGNLTRSMKRRLFYCALTVVLGLNLVVGAQIYFSSAASSEKDEVYPNLKLFSIVLERVRNDYVDGGKLSYQELIHGALKGMLNTLDPHSEFMEPTKYDDLKKDTQGEFGGVGIVISVKDNFLTEIGRACVGKEWRSRR